MEGKIVLKYSNYVLNVRASFDPNQCQKPMIIMIILYTWMWFEFVFFCNTHTAWSKYRGWNNVYVIYFHRSALPKSKLTGIPFGRRRHSGWTMNTCRALRHMWFRSCMRGLQSCMFYRHHNHSEGRRTTLSLNVCYLNYYCFCFEIIF